jgi:hypothetical protein
MIEKLHGYLGLTGKLYGIERLKAAKTRKPSDYFLFVLTPVSK